MKWRKVVFRLSFRSRLVGEGSGDGECGNDIGVDTVGGEKRSEIAKRTSRLY